MAITINGYIADTHDDTEWVKDIEALNSAISECGVVVMGRRTYDECIKYDAFPCKGALNIVLTQDPMLLKKSSTDVLFSNSSPKEVVTLAEKKGFKKLLVIGGGHINGSFLKDGLIDEIILDIHPLIMAKGIHLFESDFPNKNLELVSHKEINDQIIQIKYKVKK